MNTDKYSTYTRLSNLQELEETVCKMRPVNKEKCSVPFCTDALKCTAINKSALPQEKQLQQQQQKTNGQLSTIIDPYVDVEIINVAIKYFLVCFHLVCFASRSVATNKLLSVICKWQFEWNERFDCAILQWFKNLTVIWRDNQIHLNLRQRQSPERNSCKISFF